MANRIRIGDVIEIPTAKGLAYALYTHKAPRGMGDLLRVFEGLYQAPPKDLADLVKEREQFVAITPLQWAINQGIFRVVGNVRVPSDKAQFPPLWRMEFGLPDPGVKPHWVLGDAEGTFSSEVLAQLSEEQRKLPELMTCSPDKVAQMAERGYRAETDPSVMPDRDEQTTPKKKRSSL